MSPYTFNFIILILVSGVLATMISLLLSVKVPAIKIAVWESDDYSFKAQMFLVASSFIGTFIIVGILAVLDLGTILVYYPQLTKYLMIDKFNEFIRLISSII